VNWRILEGDAAERLRDLDPQSVQTCITSPPYWGLRDYGTATWEGGDAECDHGPTAASRETRPASGLTGGKATVDAGTIRKGDCSCGATRIDSQLGLEPTPEEYVANLVEVFREVRRVLRDDGTLWLNLGDSYAARLRQSGEDHAGALSAASKGVIKQGAKPLPVGLKEKDLVGIPWMVAFALRADGWVLRQEVIWQKPNPMPESVTDRCTKSHEQLFMFSKAKWTGMEPGEFAHISEQDARWLALFFDAEGSLVLRRERDGARHAAQISLGSTCRPLLEAAQRIVGAGNILERDGKNAPMFYWQLSNKRARDLLLRLHPYLIVKQQQARCLIDLESRKWKRGDNRNGLSASEMAYRERLWEAVKSLNSFGSPDLSWVPEPKIGRWGAGPRYFYDAEAIREEFIEAAGGEAVERGEHGSANARAGANGSPDRGNRHGFPRAHTGRNKRSVWTVTTQPFPGAHFATFPPKLIEPCILAGSPPSEVLRGVWSAVGAGAGKDGADDSAAERAHHRQGAHRGERAAWRYVVTLYGLLTRI
jgi:DNA modification methylase